MHNLFLVVRSLDGEDQRLQQKAAGHFWVHWLVLLLMGLKADDLMVHQLCEAVAASIQAVHLSAEASL